MRRKEKEITERSQIEAIIQKSTVCRLGMSENNIPYIVPLCFGYKDNMIYIHTYLKGKKIDILLKNQNVCFEFDINTEITEGEKPCKWGMKYRSVIGFGKAFFINYPEQKRKALNIIMNQYSQGTFQFPDDIVEKTSVIKIEITSMTGKQSGY